MLINPKISFIVGSIIMGLYLILKLFSAIDIIEVTCFYRWVELFCVLLFIPPLFILIRGYYEKNESTKKLNYYSKKLNEVLISQSRNPLFYEGDITEGAKELTKKVVNTLNIDRCSIWLYNNDESSLICEQLYIKKEGNWVADLEIFESDYKDYFEALKKDLIIVAKKVDEHPATKCFKDTYSDILGIKSMLDVPIIYRGNVVGVICMESFTERDWHRVEISFGEILSSIYAFGYSIWETNVTENKLSQFELFVDSTALITKCDKFGKITYANQKFLDICGWDLNDIIGKDHNIINSGLHSKSFWDNMYKKTIVDKEIWHDLVINRTKVGELYYVDTHIKAEFDPETKELIGFSSIRQDVTDLYKSFNEVNKKNTYLEHAAKILRHDMHSGINIYIPRGISSLERRLKPSDIDKLKLEAPLKLLKEGLKHTQKVYKGVYEFTNLVKKGSVLTKENLDLKKVLKTYLKPMAYSSQVIIKDLIYAEINESLFCTAIDNLIRNGLKYNDSQHKLITITSEDNNLIIQDNGRGLTQKEFNRYSQPYIRKQGQKEVGSGLGLNICIAILNEHGFKISCEKNDVGTKITIKIK